MSLVNSECVDCGRRLSTPAIRSEHDRMRCPRCGAGEVLLDALAGKDTRWYWGLDGEDDARSS